MFVQSDTLLNGFKFLNENAKADSETETYIDYSQLSSGTPVILWEDKAKRDISAKHFFLSDGTYIMEQYSEPIHYKDADGEFKEIDNSLISSKSETENEVYKNAANSFNVEFAKDTDINKNLYKVSKDGYEMAMQLLGNSDMKTSEKENTYNIKTNANKSFANIETGAYVKEKKENEYKNKNLEKPINFENPSSVLKYANIINDIDFKYEVSSGKIKENIIINRAADNYNFKFIVKVKNLSLKLSENGEIYAYAENGDIKYKIPAPFMYDNNNSYSYDVSYVTVK